jgi:hypothetical protein
VTGSGRWFRLNTTWSQSEWLAELSPAARLAWIELVGLVASEGFCGRVDPPYPQQIAKRGRLPVSAAAEMLSSAERAGAIWFDGFGDLALTHPEEYGISRLRNISGRLPAHEWAAIRNEVFERDDYTCRYCGARGGKLECDHVVPVSRGGGNEPSNLATACFQCNRSKRDKLLSEWRAA